MISCIFDNLSEIHKNDNSIGTTILGVLPSIIGAAAAQPADILKLPLISPMRGIATAAFSIGIPPRVFLRLRPVSTFLDSNTVWDDTAHSTRSTNDAGHVGEHVTSAGRSSGSYIHGWRMPP
ncbi:hypothetical protein CSOJ01_15715 [Colletotrichum sojae]|uniref:Uncharacterized protein n=1 Tax=Colletotrichum sojae TaxID=2175907 RepID=A0A8H6MI90_9PEZI|nr:hypothetical protein CSOJ01_15715 [Colletotrichum sojae]